MKPSIVRPDGSVRHVRALAATGGAGIVSPVGLALMGARRSANEIDAGGARWRARSR